MKNKVNADEKCNFKNRLNGSEIRWEEQTSESQQLVNFVCRLLLEKKKNKRYKNNIDQYEYDGQ